MRLCQRCRRIAPAITSPKSRTITIIISHNGKRPTRNNPSTAHAISTRSTAGSRICPNFDTVPVLRAICPSRKSVPDARANTTAAKISFPPNKKIRNNGAMHKRISEIRLGIVTIESIAASVDLSQVSRLCADA